METVYDPLKDFKITSIKTISFIDQVTDRCRLQYDFNLTVLPKLNITISDSIYCKNESITLYSSSNNNINWMINNKVVSTDSIYSFMVKEPITIYLTNNKNEICEASDTILINPYKIPSFSAGNDTTLCFKNNLLLKPKIPESLEYVWIDVNGILSDTIIKNPFITDDVNSAFILKVCDSICCEYDTVKFTFTNSQDFQLPFDTISTCVNDTIILNLDNDLIYIWSDNVKQYCKDDSCSELIIPVTNTSFTADVIAVDKANCSATDNIVINAIDYIKLNDLELRICDGDSVLINNKYIKEAGTYCDTFIDAKGCNTIQCYNLEKLSKSSSMTQVSICENQVYNFYNQIITTSGEYCLELNNQNGCDSSICVTVHVNQNPEIILDSLVYNIAAGTQLQLEEKGNHYSYLWISAASISCDNCSNPIISAEENTTLILIVTNNENCKDTATIRINVINGLCFENIQIPNAFTPNSNHRNDVFRIINGEHIEIETFQIYNEWGQKIFETKDNNGWDGKINNADAPQASYAYIIKAKCNNETKTLTGYVTLLR
jgi:gliding motility-associated-like protein